LSISLFQNILFQAGEYLHFIARHKFTFSSVTIWHLWIFIQPSIICVVRMSESVMTMEKLGSFFVGNKSVLIYCSVFVCRLRNIYRTQLHFEIQIWDFDTLTQVSIISCAFIFPCACVRSIKISHRTTHYTYLTLSLLLIASSRSRWPHCLKCRCVAVYLAGIAASNPAGGVEFSLL
jgi:hypothetical protein